MIRLENELLQAEISLHGAELRSLVRKDKGTSYLWYADPKFWGRTSPVLFPFVGSVKDKVYRVGETVYPMGQHGFARDRDFTLISQSSSCAWFALESDEESLKVYPCRFRLEIGYQLYGGSVRVMWRVTNTDDKTIHFSIGAHPAFMCPPVEGGDQTACCVTCYDKDGVSPQTIKSHMLGTKGLVIDEWRELSLKNGCLPITEDLFARDALVLENSQVQQVGLTDEKGNEYIRLKFDAPLVGIWSPPGKKAPFVCIEPWYGRCDAESFQGELKDREWGNTLECGGVFDVSYEIITG
ncbi:MAG: aldose 1-epimerase family protein [Lachnospiraceae bacterium]|nr:aldose 1-epimerase family protein [Lachnospiraceae bacterium]